MRKETDEDGTVRYSNISRQLHREDGPAVEHPDGTKEWYKNGKRHREDGSAAVFKQRWWKTVVNFFTRL